MELHTIDKLMDEVDYLERIYFGEPSEEQVMLALSVAKRVRRHATLLVKELAAERDQLQPKEAQANE